MELSKAGKRRAFSLIELLVAVAIIGILASLTIVSVSRGSAKARDAKIKTNATNVDKALAQYEIDHSALYPDGVIQKDVSALNSDLVPTYLRTNTSLTPATGKVAKYLTNGAKTAYMQAWELENQTETIVTSGNGGYRIISGSVSLPSSISTSTSLLVAGGGQTATVPNNSLQITGDLSVSFWIKPTALAVSQSIISYPNLYQIATGGSNASTISFTHAGAGNSRTVCSAGTLVVNEWTHVVLRRSSAGLQFSCYKNGTASGTAAFSSSPGSSIQTLTIGGGATYYLANVRIHNALISEAVITEQYNSGVGRYIQADEADLAEAWRLNEGSGSTSTAVVSPPTHNGTINSAAWASSSEGSPPVGVTGFPVSSSNRVFVIYRGFN